MSDFWLERTELLIKDKGLAHLQNAHILIVGLGGVGSYAAEALARAGIGQMTLVDGDFVDITNINRQLPALRSTLGDRKAEVMVGRLLDINPGLKLTTIQDFINPEQMPALLEGSQYDFVVDCIDSLTPKLALLKAAKRKKIKTVSAMGAGGKKDPSKIMVRDLSKTRNCLLAKQVRKRLKKEHIHKGIRCVFSNEIQQEGSMKMTDGLDYKRSFYGTISYMPAMFGLYAAAEVINHIINKDTPPWED